MAQKLCFDVLSQTLAGQVATGYTLVVPAHQRDRLEPFWARIWPTAQVEYAVWSIFAKNAETPRILSTQDELEEVIADILSQKTPS